MFEFVLLKFEDQFMFYGRVRGSWAALNIKIANKMYNYIDI